MEFPLPIHKIFWCFQPPAWHDEITSSIAVDIPKPQTVSLLFSHLHLAKFTRCLSRSIPFEFKIRSRMIRGVGHNFLESIPIYVPRPGSFNIAYMVNHMLCPFFIITGIFLPYQIAVKPTSRDNVGSAISVDIHGYG